MEQKRSYRTYPKEFKEEAVSLINNQGYSVPEAAKSLGIRTNLALAFFNISFSIRNNLFSLRKRFSSSVAVHIAGYYLLVVAQY
jgi:transposase